ncbi:MAG: hypothetical protein DI537_33645 [Stutzerimonas stutzeri]|nr:MAG: hypothetical protein DI537_33645 [Stutzerimonas stutzeri]
MTAERFHNYASQVLGVTAFVPDPNREEDVAQVASLASIQNLLPGLQHWRNASGEALSVTAGFIERMTPNASADRYDGAHYIVMHQALMTTITEFALFVFTQKEIFPGVGKAAEEESPKPAGGFAPAFWCCAKPATGKRSIPQPTATACPRMPIAMSWRSIWRS